MTVRIDVRVGSERLKKYVTLAEMIEVQKGNLEAVRDVVARFMWDEKTNDFYPVSVVETDEATVITADPRALRLLGGLTIERLTEVMHTFKATVEDKAVDPQTAAP